MDNLKSFFSPNGGLGVLIPKSKLKQLKCDGKLTCKIYDNSKMRRDLNLVLNLSKENFVMGKLIWPSESPKISKKKIEIILSKSGFNHLKNPKEKGIISNDFESYKSTIIYSENYEYFNTIYNYLP
jgi:hypothetical protein